MAMFIPTDFGGIGFVSLLCEQGGELFLLPSRILVVSSLLRRLPSVEDTSHERRKVAVSASIIVYYQSLILLVAKISLLAASL
jgi:hypothetical protein